MLVRIRTKEFDLYSFGVTVHTTTLCPCMGNAENTSSEHGNSGECVHSTGFVLPPVCTVLTVLPKSHTVLILLAGLPPFCCSSQISCRYFFPNLLPSCWSSEVSLLPTILPKSPVVSLLFAGLSPCCCPSQVSCRHAAFHSCSLSLPFALLNSLVLLLFASLPLFCYSTCSPLFYAFYHPISSLHFF